MQNPTSIIHTIMRRQSSRSYQLEPIEIEKRADLEAYLDGNSECPFGTASRFQLEAAIAGDSSALKGLGTYGMIKGAQAFIIGAVENSEHHLEDYGFLMEKAILYATGLGLGSCWLGGTFRKSRFAERISARSTEVVPAVASVGYPAQSKSGVDSIVRLAAGSDNRKPWSELFYCGDFTLPLEETEEGPYMKALRMVRLAPSASNHQPWRIVKEKDADIFHFYIQRSRAYGINLKLLRLADLQRVDMGIAMCHFEATARELNLKGTWQRRDPGIETGAAEYIASWI